MTEHLISPGASDPDRLDLIRRLKDLFLFRQWTEEDLVAVSRFSRIVEHRKGDLLFHHGDSCQYLYVLLTGRVQMLRVLTDGREVTLHVLTPGSLVACAALFLDRSFPASARVLSRMAELAYLQGGPFLRLLAERPDLSRKMIGALAVRISDLADRIESRTADSAKVRLAAWLLDQPSRHGEAGERVVHIEGSKKFLAATLGMTPETFSRSLKSLADDGILEVRNKDLVLRDPGCLAEVTDD